MSVTSALEQADERFVQPGPITPSQPVDGRVRARAEAEAAARARKEARARARAEAQARKSARAEAQEQSIERAVPREPRAPRHWGRPIALVLFLALIAAVAALQFMPIDPVPFEKAASERLGQPVRIGTVHVSLVPMPHLRFERIAIGEAGEAKIGAATANPELGSVFNENKVFRSIELEEANLPRAWLGSVLFGRGAGDSLRIDRVVARALKVDIDGLALPPLDIEALMNAQGKLGSATAAAADQSLTIKISFAEAKPEIDISGSAMKLPFGGALQFRDFNGHGTFTANELLLTQFEARALDGVLSGNARLRWTSGWSLDGELAGRNIDAAAIAAPLVAAGRLDGKGAYAMRAASPDRLVPSARLEGSFSVQKGMLGTVDLTRWLQGAAAPGGNTMFTELTGNAVLSPAGTQLRQLRLVAGLLNAAGDAAVDSQRNLSGRFSLELRAESVQARSTLVLGGTLAAPVMRR